jgi:hypothetical protein
MKHGPFSKAFKKNILPDFLDDHKHVWYLFFVAGFPAFLLALEPYTRMGQTTEAPMQIQIPLDGLAFAIMTLASAAACTIAYFAGKHAAR